MLGRRKHTRFLLSLLIDATLRVPERLTVEMAGSMRSHGFRTARCQERIGAERRTTSARNG
jgi:hypothetical protein